MTNKKRKNVLISVDPTMSMYDLQYLDMLIHICFYYLVINLGLSSTRIPLLEMVNSNRNENICTFY